MKFYYFGCWDGYGHYLFESRYVHPSYDSIPWKNIDSGLCPEGKQIEGIAKLHHKEGWTAIAFWDRSIDHRPNSNSAFLAEGEFSFDEMIQFAKERFPNIVSRFKFKIIELKTQET